MVDVSSRMRLHVGIFGRRNGGKSSIFNRLSRHQAAIVSPTPGTTTDPVRKAMEHHFLGPVMLIDTAGIDDTGELGKKRVDRTLQVAGRVDLALLVATPGEWGTYEEDIASLLGEKKIPLIVLFNKSDLAPPDPREVQRAEDLSLRWVSLSALTGAGIEDLYREIAHNLPNYWLESRPLIRDLYPAGGMAVLVVESPYELPPGRIQNPHNRIIRDALDNNAQIALVQEDRLETFKEFYMSPPHLVVADSGVVRKVLSFFPQTVPVTTTSIIMAKHRGDLMSYAGASAKISKLREGSPILMADMTVSRWEESSRSLETIGDLITHNAGITPRFIFAGRREIPDSPGDFALIVTYGEEFLTVKKTLQKMQAARGNQVPVISSDFLRGLLEPELDRILKPVSELF